MKKTYKNILNKLPVSILLAGTMMSSVQAADWLMLQGTEKSFVKKKGKVVQNTRTKPIIWGFIQVNYKKDYGDIGINPNGINTTPFSLLIPDLKSQSGANLGRARIAARGMLDKENKINYFTMAAVENSGISNVMDSGSSTREYLVDASVTFKHIPYAKIRVGQFKLPISEEALRATFASPYIEFTNFTNAQVMERQAETVGSARKGAQAGGAATVHYQGDPSTSVSAFRDKGIQVFDSIPVMPSWKFSYAYMYGNGSGLNLDSPSGQGTHIGYVALEKSFGKGKGFFTQSAKVYAWGQSGDRKLLTADAGTQTYKRKRYGIGMTYYKDGLRVTSELMGAEGMIFTGAKDTNTDANEEDWQVQLAVGDENKAYGGYFNVQYELVPKKFEVFARYDQHNRLTNDTKAERIFKTTTVGASYRFKGPTRIDFNYSMKDYSADGNANAQKVLDNAGDRVMLQYTGYFRN